MDALLSEGLPLGRRPLSFLVNAKPEPQFTVQRLLTTGAKVIASTAATKDINQASSLLRKATGRGSIPVRMTTLALPNSLMATVINASAISRISTLSRHVATPFKPS